MNVEHRLATIGTYLNPLEAHVSRALMVSEGIPAVLSNEHHVGKLANVPRIGWCELAGSN
jgi:hypothetical protein